MDLTGCRVSFRLRSIVHPDPAAVHESFCLDRRMEGVCEYFVAGNQDGGPFLMVRVRPDREPVLVPLKLIEEIGSAQEGHDQIR